MWPGLWSHKLQTNLNIQSNNHTCILLSINDSHRSILPLPVGEASFIFCQTFSRIYYILLTVHNPSLRVFVWHGGGMLQMLQRQNSSNIPSMIGPELRGLWREYIWSNRANIAWFNSARDFWQNAIDTVSALQCTTVFNAFSMKTPCGLLKMIHLNWISV